MISIDFPMISIDFPIVPLRHGNDDLHGSLGFSSAGLAPGALRSLSGHDSGAGIFRHGETIGKLIIRITGWWFGTFFIFPYIGNNHPN